MAEASGAPMDSSATLLPGIQPTTKLGGRGTPRRKTRRSNTATHSALIAERTLENKLRPFRTQYQLYDQLDGCEVTILYDDGRIDIQQQAHVHSTRAMTIHEIDGSQADTQTYHIDDLDSDSYAYLFGSEDDPRVPPSRSALSYPTNPLAYSRYQPPVRSYMNYVAYQPNPYVYNSHEDYPNEIRQIYGGVNQPLDEDDEQGDGQASKPKKRRRRPKKKKKNSNNDDEEEEKPLPSDAIEQHETEVMNIEPALCLENEAQASPATKRNRKRRQRRSNKTPPSSITGEQTISSFDRPTIDRYSSSVDDQQPQSEQHASLPNVEKKRKKGGEVHAKNARASVADTVASVTVTSTSAVDAARSEDERMARPLVNNATSSIDADAIRPTLAIINHYPKGIPDANDSPLQRSPVQPVKSEVASQQGTSSNPLQKATTSHSHSRRTMSDEKHVPSAFKGAREQRKTTSNATDAIVRTNTSPMTLRFNQESTHLNPNAPDFTPPTYRSELAPAHLQRRATLVDQQHNHRQSRSRYYSESHPEPIDTSDLRPLLSISPTYHRPSWNATANTCWPNDNDEESRNASTRAFSFHSRSTHPVYPSLMQQQPLTDENNYLASPRTHRQRTYSGRTTFLPPPTHVARQRSQSGPEVPCPVSPAHLSGIHALARIMVDVLRLIPSSRPSRRHADLPTEHEHPRPSPDHLSGHLQHRRQGDVSSDVKVDFGDDMFTTAVTWLPTSTDYVADMSHVLESAPSNPRSEDQEQTRSLISLETDVKHAQESDSTAANVRDPSAAVPEPSVAEREEEEESRNRRQHMVKQTEAREQQDEEEQQQTNSTASSGSSQYFQTPTAREPSSKEPTEIVVEQRRCSPTMASDDSCARPSSMNMSTRGHIDDERREKQSEEKYRPMGAEHRSRTNQTTGDDEQTCTIVTKNERRDNEIKSRLSFQANTDPQFNERENSQDKDMNTNDGFSLLTPRRINAAHAHEENDDLLSGKNRIAITTTTTATIATSPASSSTMNQTEAYPPPPSSSPPPSLLVTSKATSKSAASYNITSTKAIHNNNNNDDESRNRDEQYAEATPSGDERAAITTANIDDSGENRRDREKGEREKREDNIKRTPTPTPTTREQEKTEERERVKQANKTTDSVTTFTSEQHSCPSVVRLSVDDSMAHRVSSSSSFNKNNQPPTTPSSTNRSSRSTYTTHTYASTNTFNTEPTYTSPPTSTGDPRTLHSCYVTSSNYHRPPTSPATSLTRRVREYEPSYPSISRFRTPSSSSPYRKTHYLDDSDEEIINEEILEVTDMNHYPTLVERWGDDTKTVVRHEGELKIEDFVEFEEIEPTVIEEILYELIYAGDKLKTCRQISRSRSESRNFRKIKKRRTKRKRQPNDESSYLTSQASSRDNSGTRSPYYNDQLYSPERSRTPVQSVLSPSWQSTGFLSTDKSSSLDIPIRNRSDDRNYVNQIRVNESEPFLSHTQVQQYPYTGPANTTTTTAYRTLQTEPLDSRSTDLIDEMRSLSSRIDALVKTDHTSDDDDDDYRSSIGGTRGVTTIDLTPSRQHKSPSDNVIIGAISEADKVRSSLVEQDQLLASSRTADNGDGVGQAQSRTTTSDQTSVPNELIAEHHDFRTAALANRSNNMSPSQTWERYDDDASSGTEVTEKELLKPESTTGKDTDDDASFSENEPVPSKSRQSDLHQEDSLHMHEATKDARRSSLPATDASSASHESTSKPTESSINLATESKQEQDRLQSNQKQVEAQLQPATTIAVTHIDIVPDQEAQTMGNSQSEDFRISSINAQSTSELPAGTPASSIDAAVPSREPTVISSEEAPTEPNNDAKRSPSITGSDRSFDESDQDLRSFLNSLTAHLMPELSASFDEGIQSIDDEPSLITESKSTDESQHDELPSRDHDPSAGMSIKSTDPSPDEQDLAAVHIDSAAKSSTPSSSFSSFSAIDTLVGVIPHGTERVREAREATSVVPTDALSDIFDQVISANKTSQERRPTDQGESETELRTSPITHGEAASVTSQSKQLRFPEAATEQAVPAGDSHRPITDDIDHQPERSAVRTRATADDNQQSAPDTIVATDKNKSLSVDSAVTSSPFVITSVEQRLPEEAIRLSQSIPSTPVTIREQEAVPHDVKISSGSAHESTVDSSRPTTIDERADNHLLVNTDATAAQSAETVSSKDHPTPTDTRPKIATEEVPPNTPAENEWLSRFPSDEGKDRVGQMPLQSIPRSVTYEEAPASIEITQASTASEHQQPTDSLIETVRGILSAPIPERRWSDNLMAESNTPVNQKLEKRSMDSLAEATLPSEQSPDDQVRQATGAKTTETADYAVDAEQLSSQALNEAVRTILAAPVASHPDSVEQNMISLTEPSQVSTDSVDSQELPSSTKRSGEEIESQAERMTSDALTEAVEDILATPLASHHSSVESTPHIHALAAEPAVTTDSAQGVSEGDAEQLSSQALTEAVQQILATTLAPRTAPVQSTSETTSSNIETTPHIEEVSTRTVAIEEALEGEKPSTTSIEAQLQEGTTKVDALQENAELLSSQALGEAMQQILATTLAPRATPIQSTSEVTSSNTDLTPHAEEVMTEGEKSTTAPRNAQLQEPTTESVPSATTTVDAQQVASDEDAELLSTQALSEAVQSTCEATSSSVELTPHIEEVVTETVSSEKVTEGEQSTATSSDAQLQEAATTTVDAQQVASHEDAELLSTQALGEAMQQILATTLAPRAEPVQLTSEATSSSIETVPHTEEIVTKTVTMNEDGEKTTAVANETQSQEATTKVDVQQDASQEDAERLSTQALNEAVHQILGATLAARAPVVTIEKSHEQIEADADRLSSEALNEALREVAAPTQTPLGSPVESTSETTVHTEEVLTKATAVGDVTTSPIVTVVDEATESEKLLARSSDAQIQEVVTESAPLETAFDSQETTSSDALTAAMRSILATTLAPHVSPLESKAPTTESTDQSSSATSAEVPVRSDHSDHEDVKSSTGPTTFREQSSVKEVAHDGSNIEERRTEQDSERVSTIPTNEVPEKDHDHSSVDSLIEMARQIKSVQPKSSRMMTSLVTEKPSESILRRTEQSDASLTPTTTELGKTTTDDLVQISDLRSTPVTNEVHQQWDIPTPTTHQMLSQTVETHEYLQPERTSFESPLESTSPTSDTSHSIGSLDTSSQAQYITEQIEAEAERVSSEALNEAMREIFASTRARQLSPIESVSEGTSSTVESTPHIEDAIEHSFPHKSTSSEELLTTSAALDTQETTPSDNVHQEIEPERLSSEALTAAMMGILASTMGPQFPSLGSRSDTTSSSLDEVIDYSLANKQISGDESSIHTDTKEAEAEHLSSEALAVTMRAILAATLAANPPSDSMVESQHPTSAAGADMESNTTVHTLTSSLENSSNQVDVSPTELKSGPHIEDITDNQWKETSVSKLGVLAETVEQDSSTNTPSVTLADETTISREDSFKHDDTAYSTDTTRQLLNTPFSSEAPSLYDATETRTASTDSLHPDIEKAETFPVSSVDTYENATNQHAVTPSHTETTPHIEEVSMKTVSTDEVTSTPIVTLADEATESVPSATTTDSQEVSSQALADAMHQILATTLAPRATPVPSTSETTPNIEEVTTKSVSANEETSTPIIALVNDVIEAQKPSTTTTETQLREATTSVDTQQDDSQENAELLSSQALGQAMHEILATTLAPRATPIQSTSEVTSSSTGLTPHAEDVVTETVSTEKVTEGEQSIAAPSDARLQEAATTTVDAPQVASHEDAELLSTQALSEAMQQILATTLAPRALPVQSTSETTSSSVELTSHIEDVSTKTASTNEQGDGETSTAAPGDAQLQEAASTAVDTQQIPSVQDAELLSTQALAEAVQQMLDTPLATRGPSAHRDTSVVITEKSQEQVQADAERLSSEALNEALREVAAPTQTPHVSSVESTSETTPHSEEMLTRTTAVDEITASPIVTVVDAQQVASQEDAELLSSQALSEAMHQILATTLAPRATPAQSTSETASSSSEMTPHIEEVSTKTITINEETSTPIIALVDDAIEAQKHSEASTEIQLQEAKTNMDAQQVASHEDAELLSSQALGEAMQQILAATLAPRPEPIQSTLETTSSSIETTPYSEEVVTKTVSTEKGTEGEKSTVAPSDAQLQEAATTTVDAQQVASHEDAELLSSQALSEAMHEILATTLTPRATPIQSTSETTSSSTDLTPHIEEVSTKTVTINEDGEKTIVASNETPLQEGTTKLDAQQIVSEKDADLLSTQALAEAVQQMLDTPLAARAPTAQEDASVVTTETRHEQVQADAARLSSEALNEALREIRATSVDLTPQASQSTDQPANKLSQLATTTVSADVAKEEETKTDEVESLDSLAETVRQILATPVAVHLPSVEIPSEDKLQSAEPLAFHPIGNEEVQPSSNALFEIMCQAIMAPAESRSSVKSEADDGEPSVPSSNSYSSEPVPITESTVISESKESTLHAATPQPSAPSQRSEEVPVERASAVLPTFTIDATTDDTPSDQGATFFIPGTPSLSETNFQDLYDHRQFFQSISDTSSSFPFSSDQQEPTFTDEQKARPDSLMAYYELQEQRHTLMSPQESVGNDKETDKTSALTTWTAAQPLLDFDSTEARPEATDMNLDDHSYEYARRFDLESPSVISNLPTSEYRQVFGVSDEIVHAVDDMTSHVDQALAAEAKQKQTLESLPYREAPVSDSVKRIMDALDGLESDLLEHDATAEQRAPFDEDASWANIERDALQQISADEPSSNTTTTAELDQRYSALLDRIDTIERPLLDSQLPSPSSVDEEFVILEASKEGHYDDSQVEGLVRTVEQIRATPFRSVASPYEKMTHEEPSNASGLEAAFEQMLAANQYRTMEGKLAPPSDMDQVSREPTKEGDHKERSTADSITDAVPTVRRNESTAEELTSVIPGVFTSSNVYLSSAQSMQPPPTDDAQITTTKDNEEVHTVITTTSTETRVTAEPISSNESASTGLFDMMKGLLPEALRSTKTSSDVSPAIDSTSTVEVTTASADDVALSKSHGEKDVHVEASEQEQPSSTGLFDMMNGLLPAALRSTKAHETSSEEHEAPLSSSLPVGSANDGQQAVVNQQENVPSSTTTYFTSSDVYHARKQAVEPTVEDSTTVANDLAPESEGDVTVAKSFERKDTRLETIEQEQQPSSTGLFDMMKGLLPSALRSTHTDANALEAQSPVNDHDERIVSSSSTNTLFTAETTDDLATPLSTYFTSSGVYDAHKQPAETKAEATDSSTVTHAAIDESSAPSSTGLFDMMKGLLPSALRSTETSSEEHESTVASPIAHVEETTVEQVTKTSTEGTGLLDIMKSLLPVSMTASDNISHKTTTEDTLSSRGASDETTEQPSPLVAQNQSQATSVNEPWYSTQYKVADSEFERLSAPHELSQRGEEELEQESFPELQAINDYPWYSSHYTITDAEGGLDRFYRQLTLAMEQLDQRPLPTTVEFEPEPHEKATTPTYDRQALADTQDTREKVHELAQMSTMLTGTSAVMEEGIPDEDGFQVVHRRKRVPSSTVPESIPPPPETLSSVSPDIDLNPVVLHGHPDVPSVDVPLASVVSTSTKKKHKKQKKDKPETILFDAPLPSTTSNLAEQKSNLVQADSLDQSESDVVLSTMTMDSLQISEPSEEVKPTAEVSPPRTDSQHDKASIPTSGVAVDEQPAELLSASFVSDYDDVKPTSDDKNDSTSSDASLLSSSFVTLPDDDKIPPKPIEQISRVEPLPTTVEEKFEQQSKPPTSIAEPKQQQQQPKSTGKVASKKSTAPTDDDRDDNDGFQVVTYGKRPPSLSGADKTSPVKQKTSSNVDVQSNLVLTQQSSPTSDSGSAPKAKPAKKKPKKDKQELVKTDISLSSPSTDTDLISSSSADAGKVKQDPSQTSQSQIKTGETRSSVIVDSPSPTPAPPVRTQPAPVSLRVKASTSPEEEEEDGDDNEGFQLVNRKRRSSAPRPGKPLPASPSKTSYKQNLARDLRAGFNQNRAGAGSRSIPRATSGNQTTADRRPPAPPRADRPAMLPLSSPRPSDAEKWQRTSSTGVDNQKMKPLARTSDVVGPSARIDQALIEDEPLQSSFVESQDPFVATKPPMVSTAQSKAPERVEPSETKTKPIAATLSSPASQTSRTFTQETSAPQIPMSAMIPLTVATKSISEPRKPSSTEELDEDGFRVVRYRKHAPSAAAALVITKQESLSSDSDNKPKRSAKKLSPVQPATASTSTTSDEMTPKKKPKKPKPIKEVAVTSSLPETTIPSPVAREETKVERTIDEIRPVLASAQRSEPPPVTTIVQETITTEVKTPTLITKTIEAEPRPIDTASTIVTDNSSAWDTPTATKSVSSSAMTEVMPVESHVMSTEKTTVVESETHVEDDQAKTGSAKKSSKRRKKKAPAAGQHDDDESLLSSSTTSITDKDLPPAPVNPSTASARLTSDDDKQESEWRTAQGRNKKSKSIETIVTPPQPRSLPSPPIVPKIVPEKVTDVQFKFKKSGELFMTSQSGSRNSPTEWGTVKFLSEEEEQQPDFTPTQAIAIATETPAPVDQQETTEQVITSTDHAVNEIVIEPESKSIGSSETGAEADLDAYRDQAGRLRRKKPRKPTNSSIKSEDSASTNEQATVDDEPLNRQSIRDHWADVLASPPATTDAEQKLQVLSATQDPSFEDEETSESSSKLDTFLPSYIREQIKSTHKTSSSPRSSSLTDERSKSSSVEPSIVQTRSAREFLPSLSNRSTSTDTSESESRKHLRESNEQQLRMSSDSISSRAAATTADQPESSTSNDPSSLPPTGPTRKKRQRPKMLKKDPEATRLLTHEFDEIASTTAESSSIVPEVPVQYEETPDERSFFSSMRDQFASVVSNISDSFHTAVSTKQQAASDEQSTLPSDEPLIEEPTLLTTSEVTTTTTVTKKSSTRSPRKRSKRDSGPDYDSLTLSSIEDADQPSTTSRAESTASPSADRDQPDSIKVDTIKQHARQRTPSGRHISNTEEENEQQAVQADDEEDEDFAAKLLALHGSSIMTTMRTSIDSMDDKDDSSSTATTVLSRQTIEERPPTNDAETVLPVHSELQSDATSTYEALRSVQGFHSFTPNLYQYDQYEEGPVVTVDPSLSSAKDSSDTILSRGFNLWLHEAQATTTQSPSTMDSPAAEPTALTRAMQGLIIQPVDSDDDDDDEEDSWNGPRSRKPTYTAGIRTDKQIHASSGYYINHPRSAKAPSWLIASSSENLSRDDSSKFDRDEEEDAMDEPSEKPRAEGRQTQSTDSTLQPNNSQLSSTVKSTETVTHQQPVGQTALFSQADAERWLGEDFFRDSLAGDARQKAPRTTTRLHDLVLKPSDDTHEDDDDDDIDDSRANRNNNNNDRSNNFDEWGHFPEGKHRHPTLGSSAMTTPSPMVYEQVLVQECSYARALDEDTFVSDGRPLARHRSQSNDHAEHALENEPERYGDFLPMDEAPAARSLLSSAQEQELLNRSKPSESFQRWRHQSGLDHDESNSTLPSSISTGENQNDDELFISHTDGGLSRQVRPST